MPKTDDGEFWMAPDTMAAAKALLTAYDAGKPIRPSEGWMVRFASELVKSDLTGPEKVERDAAHPMIGLTEAMDKLGAA